jgi:hypothetical protein
VSKLKVRCERAEYVACVLLQTLAAEDGPIGTHGSGAVIQACVTRQRPRNEWRDYWDISMSWRFCGWGTRFEPRLAESESVAHGQNQ